MSEIYRLARFSPHTIIRSLTRIGVGMLLGLGCTLTAAMAADNTGPKAPRLVVLVVVDQLRADLPLRYRSHLAKDGGLARFLDDSVYYRQSFYAHVDNSTAPGHATISTGAVPADHGIVANQWYDWNSGKRVQAVTDPTEHIVGEAAADAEQSPGASPRRLNAGALADELLAATAGQARVFGVSAKDRGSIFTTGTAGKAFWYSSSSGHFVSSSYYYERLPKWARKINQAGLTHYPEVWALARPASQYQLAAQDDRAAERPRFNMGRVFPHPLGEHGSAEYFGAFKRSPFVDDWTVEFALAMLKHERLGKDEVSDLLTVSLSATDYIGHYFGPQSLEAEDNIIRLDQTLGRLIDGVEAQVGRDNVVFVLTADHGVDASPEHKQALGLPAWRINVGAFAEALDEHLREDLHIHERVVLDVLGSGIYLDFEAAEEDDVDPDELLSSALEWLRDRPDIAVAVLPSKVQKVGGEVGRLLRNSVDPERAGDILVVQGDSTFFGTKGEAAGHGSPYSYDAHVPSAFLLPAREGQMVWRRVSQMAIAPTLAQLLNIPAPSHAFDAVLGEVLQ